MTETAELFTEEQVLAMPPEERIQRITHYRVESLRRKLSREELRLAIRLLRVERVSREDKPKSKRATKVPGISLDDF